MRFKVLQLSLSLHIFCVAFTSVVAQDGSIRGVLTDGYNGLPMGYASVSLYRASDSVLLDGVMTDTTGLFQFPRVAPGDWYLNIQFIGYQTKTISGLKLASGAKIDLGQLSLEPDQRMLNEIEVLGRKTGAYNQIDKQVYSAGQFRTAAGGTAVDVLRNMPSVGVNGQGEITVRGSSGFLVLLNGKPVLTDAQTVLSQLPANAVESVEIITAPSAKYDPDGKAGIINITTRRGAADGWSVQANLQAGLPATTTHGNKYNPNRIGGDATVNYKKDKWEVSAGLNHSRNDLAGYREGDVYTINRSGREYITRFPSEGERSFIRYNYGARGSVAYTPDSRNSLSAGFFVGKRYQVRTANIQYQNSARFLDEDQPFRVDPYYNMNAQTRHGNFALANMEYVHGFANKSSLTFSVLYEHAKLYGLTENWNLSHKGHDADTIQTVMNPYEMPIAGYRAGLDYAIPLGTGKLEAGYQYRNDKQDGWVDYAVNPLPNPPDPARFSGSALARNQIHSVYTQYSGKGKRLEYIGGLRYEYATRMVELSYDPQPHGLDLSNLFPSASLLYTLSADWKLKAAYSRRVQRTRNYELNPIPEREHSETLEQGDPDLLPEFIDLTEAGLIHNFSGGSFFATLYHQHVKNPIQRVNSVYADTILNRLFTNAEKARSAGLELALNLQPGRWWDVYLGANVYNYRIRGALEILGEMSSVENSSWVWSFNTNFNFRLGAGWSAHASLNYLSNRPTAQGEDSRFITPNSSLKKTFANGKFSAALQWQNMDLGIFDANRQRITTWGADFYTTTNYIYETDVFMLTFSYNLNNLSGKAKLPKSEFGEKEF